MSRITVYREGGLALKEQLAAKGKLARRRRGGPQICQCAEQRVASGRGAPGLGGHRRGHALPKDAHIPAGVARGVHCPQLASRSRRDAV